MLLKCPNFSFLQSDQQKKYLQPTSSSDSDGTSNSKSVFNFDINDIKLRSFIETKAQQETEIKDTSERSLQLPVEDSDSSTKDEKLEGKLI